MSVDQKTLNHQLIQAVQSGDKTAIEHLLEKGADPRAQQSEALWQAIDCNHKHCVDILAPVSEVVHKHLFAAIDSNDWEFFSPLIEWVDLQAYPDVLNQSLVRAARFGHHHILSHLMEVADPTYQKSLAFRWAVVGDHSRCIDLLYSVSDIQHVLEYFKNDIERSQGAFNPIEKPYHALKERFDVEQLKQKLTDSVTPSSLHSLRKI